MKAFSASFAASVLFLAANLLGFQAYAELAQPICRSVGALPPSEWHFKTECAAVHRDGVYVLVTQSDAVLVVQHLGSGNCRLLGNYRADLSASAGQVNSGSPILLVGAHRGTPARLMQSGERGELWRPSGTLELNHCRVD